MIKPFEGSRLKINRARAHIDELSRETAAYLAREPVRIVVEEWEQVPSNDSWKVRIREHVPSHLGVIVGDIGHNLRAALDLMANDLVRLAGRNPTGVYFPVAQSRDGLNEMIKQKNFNRAGAKAVDFLKDLKPYRGGNMAIRALHDINVADKHKTLTPVISTAVMDLSGLTPNADEGTKAQLKHWQSRIVDDGQDTVIMPNGWGPPRGTVIKADYLLWTFTNPADVKSAGYEIIGLFTEFARVVSEIVDEFERISS